MVVSLFLTTLIGFILYRDQAEKLITSSLIDTGNKIIDLYEASPESDLVPFMRSMAGISGVGLQLYGQKTGPLLEERMIAGRVRQDQIDQVLGGGISRGPRSLNHRQVIIGLPIKTAEGSFALFLMWTSSAIPRSTGGDAHLAQVAFAAMLLIGSLLILVAARYIVTPLKRVTAAAKRMAGGRFDVEIHTSRKDEIGVLTASFNEMARELGRLDQMRQDFVTNVSHEIQSPLQSITGFTKALKQKKLSEESRERYLAIIESESERLSRLARNLLRLSSLQLEHGPHEVRAYRLDEQLRRTVIALEPHWEAKRIAVELRLEPIVIRADEDQLGQVWTNLIGNAVKFVPEGGRIRIVAAERGVQVVVQVADNGPGIPEYERTDVFKPFHMVDKSRSRASGGSGLGLSIAKQIAELHGGDIAATEAPEGGALLEVTLPLAQG